jgi:hypothetical protein
MRAAVLTEPGRVTRSRRHQDLALRLGASHVAGPDAASRVVAEVTDGRGPAQLKIIIDVA